MGLSGATKALTRCKTELQQDFAELRHSTWKVKRHDRSPSSRGLALTARKSVSALVRKMFCRVLLCQNLQKHVRVEGYLPAGSMLLK